jgi:heme/copper-type cytochrome/quinol oxidase subunit 2
MNQKLIIGATIIAAVIIVAAVLVVLFYGTQPTSPMFTVTGKQQTTPSVSGDYTVTSWNFTFVYNGANTLQNVNFYLDTGNMPFKTVPQITKGWTDQYIWTPEDLQANRTITVSWQGGTESYEFHP